MIFIGIDVASDKHDAVILNQDGTVLTEPFSFTNDSSGFKKIYTEITSHTESLDVCIGMEETGIYHNNIADFLFNSGFLVFCENASKIHHYILSQTVRSTKTDKTDSLAIAKYVMNYFEKLIPYTPKLYNTNELKSLTRLRFNKVSDLSKRKTELKRLLMISFPEFVKHFNPLSKWALELLTSYPTTDKLSRAHTSSIISIMRTKGDRQKAAIYLKDLAKSTVGKNSKSLIIEIHTCIQDITLIQKQIKSIEFEIKSELAEYDYIMTIPGFSFITTATIIGEIGDISRFDHKSKLLAFAGCEPTIYQSGKYTSKNCKISKRGSKYLRTAIFHCARVASVGSGQDNKFRKKYNNKISQGKHHYSAIFHVAKNMLYTFFTMMNTGEIYNDSF